MTNEKRVAILRLQIATAEHWAEWFKNLAGSPPVSEIRGFIGTGALAISTDLRKMSAALNTIADDIDSEV